MNGLEQKIFIHENKKEEYILVAIPDLNWSTVFTYGEDLVERKMIDTLKDKLDDETAEGLGRRIYQWTREM